MVSWLTRVVRRCLLVWAYRTTRLCSWPVGRWLATPRHRF